MRTFTGKVLIGEWKTPKDIEVCELGPLMQIRVRISSAENNDNNGRDSHHIAKVIVGLKKSKTFYWSSNMPDGVFLSIAAFKSADPIDFLKNSICMSVVLDEASIVKGSLTAFSEN